MPSKLRVLSALLLSAPHLFSEAVPFDLLKQLMPANPMIIEAGAQFGEDTQWMSKLWPNGHIYAFEPSPDTYQKLTKNTEALPNVTRISLALSDTEGVHDFYLAGGASSLLKPTTSFNNDYFHADLENPISVHTTTIDLWAAKYNVSHIDFMWLDMEGNELNALKGALHILPTVKLIYTEVNLQNFWHDCARYETLTKWLNKYGFVKIWEDIVPSWHGNVLFANKKYLNHE